MRTMRACGCGLRRIAAWSMPGSLTSSVYVARPVRSFGSSRRWTSLPIQWRVVVTIDSSSAGGGAARDGTAGRGQPHGLDDALVPGAGAEVGRGRFPELRLSRRAADEER